MVNPFNVRCPQCRAQPGTKCKNYRGKDCAPHRARTREAAAVQSADGDKLKLQINGHTLDGEKRGGEWRFACISWPDIEARFHGDAIVGPAVGEFMRRALAGAVTVKRLAEGG